ncbi:MAG TPA: hypothetical protein VF011_07345 [Terriglobales bacterium]
MKLSMISKSVLPGLVLLLATSALAANKPNKGSLDVSEPVTVSGQQLKPGEYKLKWEGTGSDVQVRIWSQGALVATVPAHVTDLNVAERSNGYELRRNDDGSQTLLQVSFGGKKYALSFDNASAASGSPAGSQ